MGVRDFKLLRGRGRNRGNIGLTPFFNLPLFKSLAKKKNKLYSCREIMGEYLLPVAYHNPEVHL